MGCPGKNAATLGTFFDDLTQEATDQIQAVSMDLGLAYPKAVRERAPHAVVWFDPFYADVLVMPMSLVLSLSGAVIAIVRSA